MAASKRTPAQRDLDLAWIAKLAEKGLSAAKIKERAEKDGRETVAGVSRQQIAYDLMQLRRAALDTGEKRYKMLLDRTLKELARLGFADLRSVLEWSDGKVTLRDCWELNEDEAAIVAGVTAKSTTRTLPNGDTETTVEVKLDTHSKVQALRDLLRHLGGYISIQVPVDADDAEDLIGKLVARLSRAGDSADRDAEGPDPGGPGEGDG